MREADRPRAMRSRRRREHLHRQRLVDGRETPTVFLGETRGAAADEQHRLHERNEFIARRRAEKADARVARLAGRRILPNDGDRGTRRCCTAPLVFLEMKGTSSIVILSESSGSSSRICRVRTQVSQSSVCVKNSSRTGEVIS